MGLASLMRPMRPLSMNRSLSSPLRRDPNGYRSDDRGTKPRWCHAILRALFRHAVSDETGIINIGSARKMSSRGGWPSGGIPVPMDHAIE